MKDFNVALYCRLSYLTLTPLMIKSGFEGQFTDSSIQKTPDGKIEINGYVWSSLIRRALSRIKGADELARTVGKYKSEYLGVSPLWVGSSYIPVKVTDTRPGNRVDRSYGCTVTRALFSDEIAPAGLRGELELFYFGNTSGSFNQDCVRLFEAFSIVNSGIENIGGGWSYGFGRIRIERVMRKKISLADEPPKVPNTELEESALPDLSKVAISEPWLVYDVSARILPGQLLAVHTKEPTQNIYSEIPDMYVYSGHVVRDGVYTHNYIIPGRTIRQALFSIPIERKLRSANMDCCMEAGSIKGGCKCKRCRWFGSFEKGGVIAVTDGVVSDANTVVLHRIQLDEHSMQNMNLFAAEYLTKGRFDFSIFIDESDTNFNGIEEEIDCILNEMHTNSQGPPGWYRLGATSTCSGHVEVLEFSKKRYGGR